MSWKKVSAVECDRKLSAKVKGKMYRSVIRSAMLYGMKKDESGGVKNGEMGIGHYKRGQDKERLRGMAKIAKLGDTLRDTRLRWHRHVKRKKGYVEKRMIEMAIPGKRKRERPKRRWMDVVRKDMEMVGAREGDEVDQILWRRLLHCSDSQQGKAKRKRS